MDEKNKRSNIYGLLNIFMLLTALFAFLALAKTVQDFYSIYNTPSDDILNILLTNTTLVTLTITNTIAIFLIFYSAYLFKKEKRSFSKWFIATIIFIVFTDLFAFGYPDFSLPRLIFHLFFLIVFFLYLFYSKEAKEIFIK